MKFHNHGEGCYWSLLSLSQHLRCTLRSVRALQTYGPISGRGCLLDEPASQWEARIYIRMFAIQGPISRWVLFKTLYYRYIIWRQHTKSRHNRNCFANAMIITDRRVGLQSVLKLSILYETSNLAKLRFQLY